MIAIGALGGSGTRAVAEVLIQAGIYMGDDLNKPNDNLIFTRLFKNPDWYRKASDAQKQKRMRIFERYMSTNKLSFEDFYELIVASKSNPTFSSDSNYYFRMLKKLIGRPKEISNWGWKEPNTQLYMSELFDFFDELKYIHVIRHGLDMAFSNNKQQLKNWGWKYDIVLSGNENEDELAIKQLDYWIESTKEIITKSKKYANRFLLINHTDFCTNPKIEIDRLLAFIDIELDDTQKEKLYSIPKNMGSNDRYLNKNIKIFENHKLKFIKDMGFEIITN